MAFALGLDLIELNQIKLNQKKSTEISVDFC